MIVEVKLSIGLVGCTRTFEVEVEDDATDQDIADEVTAVSNEYLEISWERKS